MEFFTKLFDTADFPARWTCGRWSPGHGWLHVLSDLGVWSAYFAIPLVLGYFLARRKDLPFRSIFLLFAAFILLCGTTHLMEAIIFWWPAYRLAGVVKLLTAVVSWATVFALIRVAPTVLAMRSPDELEREIVARKEAEKKLQEANEELERRVGERTGELAAAVADLRAERELLSTTLASIGDAVVTTDTAGRVTGLNPVAESLTGWAAADAVGQPLDAVFDIVNETTRQPVENPVAKALREGAIVGLANHTVLIAKDGTERPIDDSAAPIRQNEGGVVGCVLVFRDISERKRAEERLRGQTATLRAITDTTTDLIFVKDRDCRLTFANPATLSMLGLAEERAIGRDARDLYADPSEREGITANDRRIMAAGASETVEEVFTGPHGTRTFLSTKTPLRDGDGAVVGVVGVSQNITDRKRMESDLREREAFIGGVLGSITDAFFALDKDWRFTFANDEIVRRFEMPREKIVGGKVWELFPAAVGNEAYVGMHRAMAERVAVEYEVYYEPWQRWFLDKAFPTADGGLAVYSRDITDRKQAGRELQRLAAIVENSPDFIGSSDVEGNPIFVNRAGRELVGIPLDYDIRLTNIPEYFVPEERRRVAEEVLPAITTTGRWAGELTFRHFVTGAAIPVWYDLFRVDDRATGQPIFFATITRDITDRKLADEEREASQRTLNELVERCPYGIYIVEDGFRIASVNAGSQAGAFANFNPAVGRPFDEAMRVLWPEPVATDCINIFRHTLATGEPYFSRDFVNPRADIDQTESYEWELHRVTLPTGRPGVVCYYYDSSKLRRAELELRYQLDLTKSITDNATTAIFMMNDKSRCTFMNPAAEQMTGFRFEEVEGGILHNFIHHRYPDGRPFPAPECPLDRALPEGGEVRDHEDTFFRKTGEAFPVMCNARVIYERGVPVGTVIEVRDITEEKAAADELRRLMADLSEADKRKDEFLATLAHELRNPLAPLRNGLHVMKLAGGNPDAVEKSRGMMDRQVGQMTHLIDDLMDLSRISRGKIVLQKTRLRLADAVLDAVDTARPLIDERGHELVVDVPPEPLYVDADRTRLAQIFGNLLNNAAKYTEREGRIRLAVERQGSGVVVAVEDNGVGIPAHMLTRVFNMFAQVDRSLEKSQGGLGIGLNIVKKLVDMHDGSIAVESGGHGAGSRFVVRLPVVLTVTTDRPDDRNGVPKAKPARRRILVVDDNRDGADSLAEMLNIMGNDTQTAYNGLEAVAVAEAFKPDVILMDIGMPKLNGYEACCRIREQPWGRNVVIVAQTGWGQEDDKRKSQVAGFDFHMIKPVDPAALEKMLAESKATTG